MTHDARAAHSPATAPDGREDGLLSAQVGVLGSLLLDADAAGFAFSSVSPDDFTSAEYRVIFEAARALYADGKPADAVTVNALLGGGHDRTLIDILDATPTSANVEAYADILRREARIKRMRDLGYALAAARDEDEVREGVDALNAALCSRSGVDVVSASDAAVRFFERHADGKPQETLPFDFGLAQELAACRGSYGIIGARPSAGKTAFALQSAFMQSRTRRVGFFSLETSTDRLSDRLVSHVAGVSLSSILRGGITAEDAAKIADAVPIISARTLDIVQASSLSVSDIRAVTLSRHYDAVYIDYLQLVPVPSSFRYRDRFSAVSEISMDLHRLAQDTGVVVIALSQLSRPEKGKSDAEPQLSDLRESGQLEQDADFVLLLSEVNPGAPSGRRLLHVAKNKDGERGGRLYLDFDGARQTFSRSPLRWQAPQKPDQRDPQFRLVSDDGSTPF